MFEEGTWEEELEAFWCWFGAQIEGMNCGLCLCDLGRLDWGFNLTERARESREVGGSSLRKLGNLGLLATWVVLEVAD